MNPKTPAFGNIHISGRSERTATVQNTGEAHLDGSAILSNAPGFGLVSGDTYSWITVPLTGTVGFLLSGRITRTDGTGVPSVPVGLLGPVNNITSTNDKDYSFSMPPGSYTIVLSDTSLIFSPPSRNVVVTNALTGTPDTPVSIPAHQFQTYVFAFTPGALISLIDVQLSFKCTNTNPAPVISSVNTFLLSASMNPVPDMVALAATPKQNSIVNIPTLTGSGVFAMATVKVGVAGTVTVVADK